MVEKGWCKQYKKSLTWFLSVRESFKRQRPLDNSGKGTTHWVCFFDPPHVNLHCINFQHTFSEYQGTHQFKCTSVILFTSDSAEYSHEWVVTNGVA